MAERPILFNTEMVKAILAGLKTQTRRPVKCKCGECNLTLYSDTAARRFIYDSNAVKKAPCAVGDILWVRETWAHPSEAEVRNGADPDMFIYMADSPLLPAANDRWNPSIHMPKEAARIFLWVKDVRVERLNDMLAHAGEVAKEGIPYSDEGDIEASGLRFKELWDSTIKPADRDVYGWYANPWVWVIEFERCEKPEGWPGHG